MTPFSQPTPPARRAWRSEREFIPPDVQGTPIVAIACFHFDPHGSADDDLRALREFGPPPVDVVGPMPYAAI